MEMSLLNMHLLNYMFQFRGINIMKQILLTCRWMIAVIWLLFNLYYQALSLPTHSLYRQPVNQRSVSVVSATRFLSCMSYTVKGTSLELTDSRLSKQRDTCVKPYTILRDTGTAHSILQTNVLPATSTVFTGGKVVLSDLSTHTTHPLVRVFLRLPVITGPVGITVNSDPLPVVFVSFSAVILPENLQCPTSKLWILPCP